MLKHSMIVAVLLLLATTVAVSQLNRDRTIQVAVTEELQIGICEPESNMSAVGWDKNPPAGGWGGAPLGSFATVWEKGAADVLDTDFSGGRFAKCTINGSTGKVPTKIEIRHLAGLAHDNFCVFASIGAGDLLVGCVNENQNTEVWTVTQLTLPANIFAPGQDVTVKILAGGNAWPSFGTYGQLAIDYIKVIGN